MSPVITYFPVSPVAPPNKMTFDFDTDMLTMFWLTLSDSVTEASERDLSKDFEFGKVGTSLGHYIILQSIY